MLSIKKRFQFLSKFAQQAAPAPAPDATPQSTATPPAANLPPPNFQASAVWGWMNSDYNSYSVNTLNSLISLLNIALHYASGGRYNFRILRNRTFQVDPSTAPSVDTKNLLNLSILIFRNYLNGGTKFTVKPTPQQIQAWGQLISNSQAFLNLSRINPSGPIAQKVPGNLKNDILNYLKFLASYNPAR
jgi:hypothetical protein